MFHLDLKYVKCPRTFDEYCLVLKFPYYRDICSVFVDHGVIDGAEHDVNVKNRVSHLYEVILRGAPVLYLSARVPA